MKTVQISQDQLSFVLKTVSPAVQQNGILPILSNIKFTFKKNQLKAFATNLEIGIASTVPCEFSDDFITTVPAKLFSDLIATMPGQMIFLSYDEDKLSMELKGERSKQVIKCISAENFPAEPPKKELSFKLDQALYKSAIDRIAFSASDNDSQPVLASVVFHMDKNSLTVFALDGFRASAKQFDMEKEFEGTSYCVIPSETVAISARSLTGTDVSFYIHDNLIAFKSEETIIYAQIVAGKPPAHDLILKVVDGIRKDKTSAKALVNVKEFSLLCKQAEIFAARNDRNLVAIKIDQNKIYLHAEGSEIGVSEGELNSESTGKSEIGLNAKYLREFIDAAKCEKISLNFSSNSPMIFEIPEIDNYYHMIMHMRL